MSRVTRIMVLAVLLAASVGTLCSQGVDLRALKKDYPLLTERYGDKLQSREAHYIFAIDISSSMKAYESVVRESLVKFVNAVPDGDQITIIVMSDENSTNYLDLTKCITLNDKLRNSIIHTVSSNEFKFLSNGDPSDGSDGFTMAKKVLEAMNVVNSSDLTFVYLLTDFEYWTHKNRYNKNNEDWASLKPLLTDKHRGMMCKYGIELTMNQVKHPEALFKSELDNIFGRLDYQQAASAQMLSQWFAHIINDIQAHKINVMLKADWNAYLDSCSISFRAKGRDVMAEVTTPKSDLVNGCRVMMTDGGGLLTLCDTASVGTAIDNGWSAFVGDYRGELCKWPQQLRDEATQANITVQFESPYAKEINKLQGLCREDENSPDAVRLTQQYEVEKPAMKIWNSVWPLWAYILAGLAIAGIIASFIYMLFIHPDRRYTSVTVKRRINGVNKTINGSVSKLPMVIGSEGDVTVPGATWTLIIQAEKHNPIISWIPFLNMKTGYYVKLEDGDFADIINDFTDVKTATLSKGKSLFLFPYKKGPRSRIEISEGSTTNRIEIM